MPIKLVKLVNAPVSSPHQAPSNTYESTNQYLPCPELKRKGGLGKNTEQKCRASSKAVAKNFAKNCKQATVYLSNEVLLLKELCEKLLSRVGSRFTLPKIHLATSNQFGRVSPLAPPLQHSCSHLPRLKRKIRDCFRLMKGVSLRTLNKLLFMSVTIPTTELLKVRTNLICFLSEWSCVKKSLKME